MAGEKSVFILDELGIGGISTNILAISNSLEESTVCVIRRVNLYSYKNLKVAIFTPLQLIRYFRCYEGNLNIFINSARGLLFCYFLSILFFFKWKSRKIKIVFVVYHPNEFSQDDYFSVKYRSIIHRFGRNNIWFMNSACFKIHNLNSIDRISPIYLNLVVDLLSEGGFRAPLSGMRILTVARLVDFKIGYIIQLVNYAIKNPNVELLVIGSGPQRQQIVDLLSTSEASNIKLIPSVKYEDLVNYYRECSVYVGMGTTLLESSSCGVPSIVAITGEKGDYCYGWFCDQDDFNVGEYIPMMPRISIVDLLNSYCLSSDVDKFALSSRHLAHVEKFALNNTLSRLKANLVKSDLFVLSIFCRFYYFIILIVIFSLEYFRVKITSDTRYDRIDL